MCRKVEEMAMNKTVEMAYKRRMVCSLCPEYACTIFSPCAKLLIYKKMMCTEKFDVFSSFLKWIEAI